MKRKNFIATFLTLAVTPFASYSRSHNRPGGPGKGFKIKAGEGRFHGHIKLKSINSNVLDVKVSGKDTGGGLAIFEQTSLSQGRGTPLHIHPLQDEIFYVLDGEYYFQIGDDTFRISTGDSIFLPRNIPHAWTQVSEKGRMTVTFQPAGKMEDFFLTVAALEHEPSKEEMEKIFIDSDMRIVGPPLKTA